MDDDNGLARLEARFQVPTWRAVLQSWVVVGGFGFVLLGLMFPEQFGLWSGFGIVLCCWAWLGLYSGWWVGVNRLHDMMHLELQQRLKGKNMDSLLL